MPKYLYRLTACVTIICTDRSVAHQYFSSLNVLHRFYHRTQESTVEDSESMSGIHDSQSYLIQGEQELKMASILYSLEVELTIFTQNLHSPTLRFESDLSYSGLELDHNMLGLEPVSVDYGPGSAPVLSSQASRLFFCSIFAAMIGSNTVGYHLSWRGFKAPPHQDK